mgnify:CR=1 FL=1
MDIYLKNSMTGKREVFRPNNPDQVGVYFCGPTVYDNLHIGNLRALLTADILVRTLRTKYNVLFVRNITDVDDKIIARANEAGISMETLTEQTIKQFHQDVEEMHLLHPDIEPRATNHIEDMVRAIAVLERRGHTYMANGSVMFDVSSYQDYGLIARRKTDAGENHRAIISDGKRNPEDFVLWKHTSDSPSWPSPWGFGRPGWHIECSVMSQLSLGENFDIHGGGHDLIFPHHENENAQSMCMCDHHTKQNHKTMANYWIHNGMLTIENVKMSKSLRNFITIRELLNIHSPDAIRFFMLSTHYGQNLKFSLERLRQTERVVQKIWSISENAEPLDENSVLEMLYKDLNTPGVIAFIHEQIKRHDDGDLSAAGKIRYAGKILGLFGRGGNIKPVTEETISQKDIEDLISLRNEHKKNKQWEKADKIRETLKEAGIQINDVKDGTTWSRY